MNPLIKDKLLLLILILAFSLRIIGLTPNFLQHPDEPVVINPSAKIAINLIEHLNPDPNVDTPFPFQYATAIFYLHSIIEIIVLTSGFLITKVTGITFEINQTAFGNPAFIEFLKNIGPLAMSNILLWSHRLPSVLFGTATVFLVYKTALSLLKNRNIALSSALALAVIPHHVRDSHYATVNIIQAFFFLLAFFLSAKIWQKTSLKNYALAGLSVGFATSLKYFPLPLLPLLFFHATKSPKNIFSRNIYLALFAALIGYWIGMPYLFVYPKEILSVIPFQLNWYAPEQLETQQNILERFLPSYIHGFHLQFFFKTAVGPILAIAGALGILSGLLIKRWRFVTVSLLIIPVINMLFISFYLEAIYETLTIPLLPFFAIFVGIGAWILLRLLKPRLRKGLAAAGLLSIIFLPPLLSSAKASLACTQPITEFEAHDWIAENIPEGAVLAFQPNMRLPSKDFQFVRSEPKENFLLSEIQITGAGYVALHSGYTDRYRLWIQDNIFLPSYIKDNEFTNLVLKEFEQNAQLLESFVRPTMCVNSRIYVYKVPAVLPTAQTPLATFEFTDQNISDWQLGKPGVPSGTTVEAVSAESKGIARYSHNPEIFSTEITRVSLAGVVVPKIKLGLPLSFYGTPFRSPFVAIIPGEKYSARLVVKRGGEPGEIPNGVLRLDFYKEGNEKPISTRFSSRLRQDNDDWQKLIVTSYAPSSARFATISFQTLLAGESSEYLIKEATIFSD